MCFFAEYLPNKAAPVSDAMMSFVHWIREIKTPATSCQTRYV